MYKRQARDGRGHQILIISDGMGRGSRAALDGAMGAGLLSRLLSAGSVSYTHLRLSPDSPFHTDGQKA